MWHGAGWRHTVASPWNTQRTHNRGTGSARVGGPGATAGDWLTCLNNVVGNWPTRAGERYTMMVFLSKAEAERLDSVIWKAASAAREEAENAELTAGESRVRELLAAASQAAAKYAGRWPEYSSRAYHAKKFLEARIRRLEELVATPGWCGDGRAAFKAALRGRGLPTAIGRTLGRLVCAWGAYQVTGLSDVAFWGQSDGLTILVTEDGGYRNVLTGEFTREDEDDPVGGLVSMHKGRAW